MAYELLVTKEVREYLSGLGPDDESQCINGIKKLENEPKPGRGKGNKKKLSAADEDIHRLHIGRSYIAFYKYNTSTKKVKVIDLRTFDKGHKMYGRY